MPRSKGTEGEWVGGRRRSPFYVTEVPPYRPDIVLWMELPSNLVLAVDTVHPDEEPSALARTLTAAMTEPLVGPPRRPRSVRVADEADAAEARAALFGSDIEVIVAPTPELDALFEEVAADLGGAEGDEEPSYLEGGRVSPEVVADLFAAARALYAMAPWKQLDDDQTLRLDIPVLGVEGACVSIIGALGQSHGLVIFPSAVAYQAFVAAAGQGLRPGAPVDLGTTTLSLTFEPATKLPAGMRREALEYGWPVAGPDAYPRVEHRDRDGVPRPLEERDLEIATRCALALVGFVPRSAGGGGRFTPHSATFRGDDDVAVRLTAPYEAYDLFDPVPEHEDQSEDPAGRPAREPGARVPASPSAAPAPPPTLSRNAPCWCGSGRRYKRCHYRADRSGRAPAPRRPQPAAIHEVDNRLLARMAVFAAQRFGKRWARAAECFRDPQAAVQLFRQWATYHHPVDGRPVFEWYLAEHGRELSGTERSWLEAQRGVWLGVWEMVDVRPGEGMRVRDLLSGATCDVVEVAASRRLVTRDVVLGRVVDHAGASVFAGVHPRPLPPLEAAEVVERVRTRVRRRRAIPVDRLRQRAVERYLIARWEETVEALDARRRRPPQLCNTDGDPLLLTSDHFWFRAADRERVAALLSSLDGVHGPEPGAAGDESLYRFVRQAHPGRAQLGDTVIGTAALGRKRLRLETNSLARADRLRAWVETAAGNLLQHRARSHDSLTVPPPGARVPNGAADSAESPQLAAALREAIERYYDEWLDQPVPALGGKTPRQAVRTRAGREQVEVLLKLLENSAARTPSAPAPDVTRLRRELGIS